MMDFGEVCKPGRPTCVLARSTFSLFCVQSAVLVVWFAWTIYVTTRAARLMGQGWTRERVLRKVSMTKVLIFCKEGAVGQDAWKGYVEEQPFSASIHPMH